MQIYNLPTETLIKERCQSVADFTLCLAGAVCLVEVGVLQLVKSNISVSMFSELTVTWLVCRKVHQVPRNAGISA